MGALHSGHLSLINRSVAENDVTCVSIFINPLQFNNPADYERYPRDFKTDQKKLNDADCDMVFMGTLTDIFPGVHSIDEVTRLDPGVYAKGLEGEFRPGHMDGVCTVVDRLFRIVGNCRAYFGEKDYQQLLVVKDLASRLGFPQVVNCATVRDADGLALSSRNELLTVVERENSLYIHRALLAAKSAWDEGIRDCQELHELLTSRLAHPGITIDYAELRDPTNWQAKSPVGSLKHAIALIAVHVGAVRLIDNMILQD